MLIRISKGLKEIVRNREFLFMLLPAVLFFILFSYIPMLGIIIAFKQFNYADGILGSEWVGFDNFKYLIISGGEVFRVIRNTVLYNITFIVVNNVLQIACAIFLAEITSKVFKKITQGIMFLPYFISWVVVGSITYNLLNYEFGFVNAILKSLQMELVNFYGTPIYWIFIIVAVSAWKSLGYGTVVYMATIMGIDAEMYEAAQIDGANIFHRIRYITIPNLKPTIIILVLFSIGNIFRGDFSMFYQLVGQNGVLYPVTDVLDTFVTRSLLQSNEVGMSAATGLLQSVFCFVTIMIVNTIIKRNNEEYSLF